MSNGVDGILSACAGAVDDYGGVGYAQPDIEGGWRQPLVGDTWTVHWVDSAGVVVGTHTITFTD